METILYETKTFCPICSIIERKGLILKSAVVFSRDDKVYLRCNCDQNHNKQSEILYCSSLNFFKRILSFDPVIGGKTNTVNKDIENMGKYFNDKNQITISNNPTKSNFVIEFSIFQNSNFLSNDEIKLQIQQFLTYYQKNKKFVLKITARGSNNLIEINERVKFISSNLLKGYPILLEVTLEKLTEIGKLNDSCLLGAKVYPAVKYFLKNGDESLFLRDINKLLLILREYSDMQCVITIAMERKFANLTDILSLLRKSNDVIRFIILSLERPPKELVDSLIKNNNNNNKQEVKTTEGEEEELLCNINDPYELIKEIEKSTNNSIQADDFFPLNVGQALEPMLNMMGYGLYSIKPSSYCSFATCLVNTSSVESKPINRFLNLSKLYYDLLPILPEIEEKIGFFNGLKIKSILKSCNIPGVPLPNLFEYLTDRSKSEITKKVIDQTQVLIIHNNMDIASLDLKRRCNCSIETKSKDGFISSCTGCI